MKAAVNMIWLAVMLTLWVGRLFLKERLLEYLKRNHNLKRYSAQERLNVISRLEL